MRFLFFLLLLLFIHSNALSQSLSGYIAKLEKEIADAKTNNADPGKIIELEKILEEMKFTQSYLDKGVIPKPKTKVSSYTGASWSGFLSSRREGSSQVPVSTRSTQFHLFFSEAVPTLHRNFNENDELNFTDDKGSGTLKDHSVITLVNETYTCDCSGAGPSELHEVVVDMLDSTYSIDALAPVCTGSTSDDGSCGMTWSFTISNQKLTNSNVLAGSSTVTNEISGIKGTVTNTWYLIRTIDAELIVKPRDYDNWLPIPGKDEKSVGNTITVDLMLQGKNGKPLKQKAKSFEIMLSYTSREPGITINFPLSPVKNGTPPDLQLLEQPNSEIENESQKMKIDCEGCTTSSFKIGAFDGGAYSTLTAVAILEDDSRITGHLSVPTGTTEITIPKRNGSMIGEAWLKKYGNPGDFDDKDTSNRNKNNGDGLTAYEEYRGVISEDEFGKQNPNKFGRLDPNKKELGILLVRKSEKNLFAEGFSWFSKASDIKTILFNKDEIPDNRRINQNGKSAHDFDQFVLRIQKGNTGEKDMQGRIIIAYGVAYPSFDIPARVTHIIIDVDLIHADYQRDIKINPTLPYTEKEVLANTIAHEIGHGVNVDHHGEDLPYLNTVTVERIQDTIIYLYPDLNNSYLVRPFTIDGPIGVPGNQQCGDENCVMCYVNRSFWVQIKGRYTIASVEYHSAPDLPYGNSFCKDKKGNGRNATGKYYGDAINGEHGNCLSRIKLRD